MTHQEAAQFLQAHDNYLILTHKRPDGDTIGCGAGLCRILHSLGKTAWLLPSLDATALFQEYLEGVTAPEGYQPSTVVSVDVAAVNLLPPNAQPYAGGIHLAIDHHPSQEFFAAHTCLEEDKAACGEIIWEIAQDLGVMNAAIATPLYVAVSTDTGCFVYSNTTPHTHRVAAALMEQGIDYKRLNKKHFRTKTAARMRVESLLFQGLYVCHQGTVAVATLSLEMMDQAGATQDDIEDIAAVVGQLEGLLHSATIRELRPGACKISLRTNAKYLDASAVCAHLGGGGHRAAAGCTVLGSVEQAKAAILQAIDQELNGQ